MIELRVTLDNVDYNSVADVLVPLVASGMKDGKGGILGDLLAKNPDTAASMARTILAKLPQEKKDALLLQMLEKYHDPLLQAGRTALLKHGIHLELQDFSAERK